MSVINIRRPITVRTATTFDFTNHMEDIYTSLSLPVACTKWEKNQEITIHITTISENKLGFSVRYYYRAPSDRKLQARISIPSPKELFEYHRQYMYS